MPTVSIIIPVYKAEHYLDACMRSVVGQSCTDLEILLVDDGSPDRSPEMCDAWAARDPRVRVLHRKTAVRRRLATLAWTPPPAISSSSPMRTTCWNQTPSSISSRPSSSTAPTLSLAICSMSMPRTTRWQSRTLPALPTRCAPSMRWGALLRPRQPQGLLRSRLEQALQAAMFDTPASATASGTRISSLCWMCCAAARRWPAWATRVTATCSTAAAPWLWPVWPATTWNAPSICWNGVAILPRKATTSAEGLLNDAIENLSQKENFDLSTQWQQARYHELRHSCAEVYRLLSRRTGRKVCCCAPG